MELVASGQVEDILEQQTISSKYRKRELILRVDEEYNGNIYPQYLKFTFVNNKVDILEKYAVGQFVTISANVRGNKWEKEGKIYYFTELQAWQIKAADQGNQPPRSYTDEYQKNNAKPNYGGQTNWDNTPSGNNSDDLPF